MISCPNEPYDTGINLTRGTILNWLYEDDPVKLESLWIAADKIRHQYVGDDIHLRGLLEISNYCRRHCAYCGVNAGNRKITRYRMTNEEVLASTREAAGHGYGTVVLQSGEDIGLSLKSIEELIRTIKAETDLAVTLSLGERTPVELEAWRKAGADRYLLRFETSNTELYKRIHPSLPGHDYRYRMDLLETLRDLEYETGSGVIIGIPGQSYEDLANDIMLFGDLDLDMIGVGPFIPHPNTLLGGSEQNSTEEDLLFSKQLPNTEFMTLKVVALSRLICPRTNIPATTALATINPAEGYKLGLLRGANVLMPNITPDRYRIHYEIYPNKVCIRESSVQDQNYHKQLIQSIGRNIGRGPGSARPR